MTIAFMINGIVVASLHVRTRMIMWNNTSIMM